MNRRINFPIQPAGEHDQKGLKCPMGGSELSMDFRLGRCLSSERLRPVTSRVCVEIALKCGSVPLCWRLFSPSPVFFVSSAHVMSYSQIDKERDAYLQGRSQLASFLLSAISASAHCQIIDCWLTSFVYGSTESTAIRPINEVVFFRTDNKTSAGASLGRPWPFLHFFLVEKIIGKKRA
jgi:hypothetical protein